MQPSKVNVEVITDERGAQYGDFTTQAQIAQTLKAIVRNQEGWHRLEDHQRESLEMILHKVSRILNGDPNVVDSWADIAGYAHIVAIRIPPK